MKTPSGISGRNRGALDRLHRELTGPFSVNDAAKVLGLEQARARRLLASFATNGWLSRIRRNSYCTVPLGATSPSEWHEDPWAVAMSVFAPCYLGGWTACGHWELTDQLFRDIVVMTSRRMRRRMVEIQGTRYVLKRIGANKLFGTTTVWRGETKVQISSASRTLVDILDDPALGGGIRHVADVVDAYFNGGSRNDAKLLDYAARLGNRTVYKRLGYLIEALGLDALDILKACAKSKSSGLTRLDPSGPDKSRIVKRWNLRVNVHIIPGRETPSPSLS